MGAAEQLIESFDQILNKARTVIEELMKEIERTPDEAIPIIWYCLSGQILPEGEYVLCLRCENKLPKSASFCTSCGLNLKAASMEVEKQYTTHDIRTMLIDFQQKIKNLNKVLLPDEIRYKYLEHSNDIEKLLELVEKKLKEAKKKVGTHARTFFNLTPSKEDIFCPHCELENPRSASFCIHCGRNLIFLTKHVIT